MAKNSVPSWREAILHVLEISNGQSLGYGEIAKRADRLRRSKGGGAVARPSVYTPLKSLVADEKVKKTQQGYVLSKDAGRRSEEEPKAAKAIRARGANRITVTSYGLNWRLDDVDWNPIRGRLLGKAEAGNSDPVDFAGQDAVYLLKEGNGIVYAGQTSADTSPTGLYSRLRQHYRNKMDRWNTFSWFGFRPVNEKDGQLLPAKGTATTGEVIDLIEAILIEALPAPALNKQRGKDTRDWIQYRQQRDPSLK